jgi:hypothetical protein
MTRFVLTPSLGSGDTASIALSNSEKLVAVDFADASGALRYGIGRALRDLKKLGLRPSSIGLDLLTLASLVYVADTRINRAQVSEDGWTREIRIVVPVHDITKWNACQIPLAQTLRFLTGDLWAVDFRAWPSSVPYPLQAQLEPPVIVPFDSVSLFSGGLDSLIGAIDSLSAGRRPLFASHGGDSSVSDPQQSLFDAVAREFSGSAARIERIRLGFHSPKEIVPDVGVEDTTRGRSFLFFALGAMVGSSFGKPFVLSVPENGFISLNVPLDGTRLGSNSTRTTHPYYIHRWNELLRLIQIPCTVENPYWDKTKGEMIRDCLNRQALARLAPMSVSCAHPSYKRWAKDGKSHCGTCLPCIIRRAAFASSPIADPTDYRIGDLAAKPLDSAAAEGAQVRAVQFAIARLKASPKFAEVAIHKPGPLMEDVGRLSDLLGVFVRGMAEVEKVVSAAVTVSSQA